MTEIYHKLCNTCPFGTIKLEALHKKIAELEARNAELEHWLHGYRTPEKSMSAMDAKIAELQERVAKL